jgi:serine/threonine protein kinase
MAEIVPGSIFSHYRILSPLGEGGMGIVYLAEDVTLGRRAALKFLPEKKQTDAATLERFLREARAASALNHPGICTIYEFGEHEGRPYLAMEMLDGGSLDKLLFARPASLDRLLDLGIQAADALDAAHRRGVIHRDIKPANLFVTISGQLKVLDFGLAKITEVHFAEAEERFSTAADNEATAANSLTRAGAVLGTVGYMSPEQARGEKLDARTDLFSLGVVLYQSATGCHPFPGTTNAVIFDKILNHNPHAAEQLNPILPPEFGRILNKTLEKNLDFRYQSAADLRADLKRLQRETASNRPKQTEPTGSLTVSSKDAGPSLGVISELPSSKVVTAEKAASRAKMWGIGAAVLIVLVAIVGWRLIPRNHTFSVVSLRQITDSGDALTLAMSPDGRTLAIVKKIKGQQSLWLRNIPTNAETQILPPFGGGYAGLAFSGDGNNLYFSRTSEDGVYIHTLYTVPVFGGTPRALIRDVDSAPSFSPDGKLFVYLREALEVKDHLVEMHVVNRDLSGDVIVYEGISPASNPLWSPDGKKIAWSEIRSDRETCFRLYDLSAKRVSTVLPIAGLSFHRFFAWMPDSSRLVATYFTQQSDSAQLGLLDLSSGQIIPITNDLSFYGAVALSADGHSFATISTTINPELSVYKDDRVTPITTASLPISPAALAWQDAGHIAFIGHHRINLYDRVEQTIAPIDAGEVRVDEYISACPDGRLVFTGVPKGADHPEAFRVNSDGADLTRLTTGPAVRDPQCVVGGTVNYSVSEGNSLIGWSTPLGGGVARKLLTGSPTTTVAFSKDSKEAVARVSGEKPQDERTLAELYDLAHPGSPTKPLTIDPRWPLSTWHISPDGRAIVYPIVERGQWSLLAQPFTGEPSYVLTERAPQRIADFGWSPEGTQLVVLRKQSISNVVLITDKGSLVAR